MAVTVTSIFLYNKERINRMSDAVLHRSNVRRFVVTFCCKARRAARMTVNHLPVKLQDPANDFPAEHKREPAKRCSLVAIRTCDPHSTTTLHSLLYSSKCSHFAFLFLFQDLVLAP